MRNRHYIIVSLSLFLLACPPEKPEELMREKAPEQASGKGSQPVAVINGETITYAEFDRRLNNLPPYARARYSSLERRQKHLETVLEFELLADEAERRGLEHDPEAIHAMKEALKRRVIDAEYRKRHGEDVLDQETLRDWYEAHRERFETKPTRTAAVVIVDTKEDAEGFAADMAEKEFEDTTQRVDVWRRMAVTYSVDRSRGNLANVGPLHAPGHNDDPWKKKVAKHVFELEKIGQLTQPFRVDGTWAVAMLVEKTAAETRPLEDVEDEVREAIIEERREAAREALVSRLREDAVIKDSD